MNSTFSGFDALEPLHEGERSSVFRAVQRSSGAHVIVKVVCPRRAEHEPVGTLAREFEILKLLDEVDGVPRAICLARDGARCALVMDDSGGTALSQQSLAGTMTIEETVELALRIVTVLERLHGRGVIHRDVNPSNIIYTSERRSVEIIDFGISTVIRGSMATSHVPSRIEGTLAYLSPEQTGRMNRPIDHRSDFYSFGATLFELITGAPPFEASDLIEIIHAHVAREPASPTLLRPGTPAALSGIVLKLLAKDADARYQTHRGLRADLQRCLDQLRVEGDGSTDLVFGGYDVAERFCMRQRVYGRERETAVLLDALAQAADGQSTIVTISGAPGIGKSMLIHELYRPVTTHRGYFLAGKFEETVSGAPYLAIRQVVSAFVDQILAEPGDAIAQWNMRLREATVNLALLADFCPSLTLILGPQSAPWELPPQEALSRLHQTLREFFRAVTAAGRVVCIFFDDVQWAGADSLRLIQQIEREGAGRQLLLLCAYRSDDRPEPAAIDLELGELGGGGAHCQSIHLSSLSPAAVAQLTADYLGVALDQAQDLAEIVQSRTEGNPFFARAFLESLRADGLLGLAEDGVSVKLDQIRQRGVTDNVVHILLARIAGLPPETRDLLLRAACIGQVFNPTTLRSCTPSNWGRALLPAIEAGLILPLDPMHAPSELETDVSRSFRFAHDRIHEVILGAATEEARLAIHLEIGRSLRRSEASISRRLWLFDVVSQLNRSRACLDDPGECQDLAQLDLEAARLALTEAAGDRALDLASTGHLVLGSRRWENSYGLTLELGLAAAEACFVTGDLTRLGTWIGDILEHARTARDVIRVRRLEGQVHYSQQRAAAAIRTYLGALEDLGIELPLDPTPADVDRSFVETAGLVAQRQIAALADLPTCQDAEAALAMELLSKLVFATLIVNSQLQSVVVFRLIQMSLVHGNVAESATGYIFYGLVLSARNEVEAAVSFANLAMRVAERHGDRGVLAQTYLYANYQLLHWTKSISELVPALLMAYRYGLESGVPFTAACAATTYCIARLLAGENLAQLETDMERIRCDLHGARQTLVVNWHEIHQQAVHNLCHDVPNPTVLAGPIYDEGPRVPKHVADHDFSALFTFHFEKMQLCYLFGDHIAALASADATRELSFFASALWAIPLTLLDSLSRLASIESCPERRTSLLEDVKQNQQKLLGWLQFNRTSVEYRLALVDAEMAVAVGDSALAEARYGAAVELARSRASSQELGIACERAARFHLRTENLARARGHLREARRAFARWGASRKVRQLEEEFPFLLPKAISGPVTVRSLSDGRTPEFDVIDMASVLNGSRALARELDPAQIPQTLLRIVLEWAGAQRGYVLMLQRGRWVVEAGRRVDSNATTTLEALPIEALEHGSDVGLPLSIVHYTARTKECVVLDDAVTNQRFGQDDYVNENQVRSILCIPLLRHDEAFGLLYLENRLLRGVFSAGGVAVLEVLAAQAVISLDNAKLYSRLAKEVSERTEELESRNRELAKALERQAEMQRQLVTQEKLAALGAVTAGIAHEIKNPLNFVTNFGQLAVDLADDISRQIKQRGGIDEGADAAVEALMRSLRDSVGKVVEHGRRANGIVAAMASHGGPSAGHFETVELNALIAESVRLVEAQSDDDAGWITMRCASDAGRVEVVADDMRRVLVNVLNNARYSVARKRGYAGNLFVPEIVVTSSASGDCVEVAVRDNGIGIPGTLLDRIFTPFFTTKLPAEGTGLGLSISYDVVTRVHQGTMRVESIDGQFAEFIVTFPRYCSRRHIGYSA